MPAVQCPAVNGWEWKQMTTDGDVIDAIVNAACTTGAGLVVMSTDGRNGFLDALRGSHSERVLRHVPAPLLTVPAGSFGEASLAAMAP
jgi:nucleotide-binding universal stress UspA family protein